MNLSRLLGAVITLGTPAILHAAAPATKPADQPTTVKLTLTPRATTRPALKHRLLPDIMDLKPGNSVPVYLTAVQLAAQVQPADKEIKAEETAKWGLPAPSDGVDRVSYFLNPEMPLDKLPKEAAWSAVNRYSSALQYADLAARRRFTAWDSPISDLGFETLLPHLAVLRDIARVNCLRMRLQIAAGDYDAAVLSMQTNLALARATAEQGPLISALVGTAIAAMTLERVNELIARPDAPNLYWPLAELPRPFIDLRQAMQWEKEGLMASLPTLQRVKTGNFTGEDWAQLQKRVSMFYADTTPTLTASLGALATGVMILPAARAHLARQGMTTKQIDEIPQPQVIGRYLLETHEIWSDEISKWASLPYWQAAAGLEETEKNLRKAKESEPLNPMYHILPGISRAFWAGARLERQIAAWQTVEAIRHHQATHAGQFLARLEEITATPLPVDPATGKLFIYKAGDRSATLESPAPRIGQPRDALRVEMTSKK
jgi:hypothetical protein